MTDHNQSEIEGGPKGRFLDLHRHLPSTAFVLLHQQVGADAGAIRGRGYWQAGPDALIRAVAAVAERHGVTVRTGAEVRLIPTFVTAAASVPSSFTST